MITMKETAIKAPIYELNEEIGKSSGLSLMLTSMGIPNETYSSTYSKLVSTNERKLAILSYYAWATSLGMTVSNFTLHLWFHSLVFLLTEQNSIVKVHSMFIFYSSIDAYLDGFHLLHNGNKAALNMDEQVFL